MHDDVDSLFDDDDGESIAAWLAEGTNAPRAKGVPCPCQLGHTVDGPGFGFRWKQWRHAMACVRCNDVGLLDG